MMDAVYVLLITVTGGPAEPLDTTDGTPVEKLWSIVIYGNSLLRLSSRTYNA